MGLSGAATELGLGIHPNLRVTAGNMEAVV